MRFFITGGAGFIGSNLVDRLLAIGHEVTVFDNFSTGQSAFLENACQQTAFHLVEGDLLNLYELTKAMAGHDFVFHLAANADVRFGTQYPRKDLDQNTIGAFHVLEAMRATGVRRIAFSSSGSIYGDPQVFPTPETCPFPVQTSLYGASKLAGEGLIAAYCTGFGFQAYIFRFVSILGERYTHGHVFDFYKKLLSNPHEIEVLGNGQQRKSYLYVQDCIDAILIGLERSRDPINIFNLGTEEYCTVNDSLDWICGRLGVTPKRRYTGGARGWIGDSPFIFLDTTKVRGLGWRPKLSIREGVLRTLSFLQVHPELLERRRDEHGRRVAVYGLWHLGCVTAACLAAAGNRITALDLDERVVNDLQGGQLPVHEPGLAELIAGGIDSGRLQFTNRPGEALRDAEVLWVTFDTPVNERDEANVAHVRAQLEKIGGDVRPGTLVLISSQVPVGFTKALERDWSSRRLRYAYAPENLRLGQALETFQRAERVIVGFRDPLDQPTLAALFAPFCRRIEWMSVESAEMTKHAINAYLATSVTFANELARLCEVFGADAKEVERGLKSEPRIGPRAYLAPGAAFAGGTLARDLCYLVDFGRHHQVDTLLFRAVLASNEAHKSWVRDKLHQLLRETSRPVVAVLGLTYKPGTDTLRRSAAVEHCVWLNQQGVRVQAHDPAVGELPAELRPMMIRCGSPQEALTGADIALVATEWPEYRFLRAEQFVERMRRPQVIDPNHFLADVLSRKAGIVYFATGKAAA